MKVLIVDDESYFIEYLLHVIDWKKYHLTPVFTSNPKEAQEILKKQRIELLLTDIKMPEVTGIDLLQFIQHEGLNVKTILISGYSDFEYAKKGIQLGAVDYLLKPLTKDDLESALLHYFTLKGKITQDSSFKISALLLGLLKVIREEEVAQDALAEVLENNNMITLGMTQETITDTDVSWLRIGEKNYFLLEKESHLSFQEEEKVTFSLLGVDDIFRGLLTLFTKENISSKDFNATKEKCQRYIKDPESFANLNKKKSTLSSLEKKYLALKLLAKDSSDDFSLENLGILQDEEKIAHYLQQELKKVGGQSLTQQTILKIQEYVKEHLEQDLNLEEIAEQVYLNPTYLSKLYKKETGSNLSTYILNQRLEKAKKLLKESKLLISDIGTLTGFNSSQYFIRVFKEKYDMTPQQFRRMTLI